MEIPSFQAITSKLVRFVTLSKSGAKAILKRNVDRTSFSLKFTGS